MGRAESLFDRLRRDEPISSREIDSRGLSPNFLPYGVFALRPRKALVILSGLGTSGGQVLRASELHHHSSAIDVKHGTVEVGRGV